MERPFLHSTLIDLNGGTYGLRGVELRHAAVTPIARDESFCGRRPSTRSAGDRLVRAEITMPTELDSTAAEALRAARRSGEPRAEMPARRMS
ncbi:hypothetical protein ACFVKB_15260 [Rhodococcus sp. NPDC127530]|uniref:hypothetical protein n=1 Tax=Rhodococcus sp. NPDC127530 TaxID=3345397 RepID=UPI00363AC2D5